ncbi:MAG: 1-hydroxycarotenoid 3,4-desaturase CrtD [Pikeienuella sp.]
MAQKVAVIGAGLGGLAAALDLAVAGWQVTLCEAQANLGGKARQVSAEGRGVDAGPTVFTMRWIFEALFAAAGARLDDHLSLTRAELIARHAWTDGSRLDLFNDPARSEDAIAGFAGQAEAARFRRFSDRAARVYSALAPHFIEAQKPSPLGIARAIGPRGSVLQDLAPLRSLAGLLAKAFQDPRLRQLFGRYATYVGGSPYLSPALLMLIWHVEEKGVWHIKGGMHALAQALARLAQAHGAEIRRAAPVDEVLISSGRATGLRLACGTEIPADAVVFNGDAGALGAGLLGAAARRATDPVAPTARSLSALTVTGLARTEAPYAFHTVAFSSDYRAEFDALLRDRRLPAEPTVYVCAQDRAPTAEPQRPAARERVLMIINAPPDGDHRPTPKEETERCLDAATRLLARAGLPIELDRSSATVTPPQGWAALFPGTGGALYGRAPHGSFNGAMASFARPAARSRIPGLYLAGGSAHPGAGVPLATM